MRKYRAIGATAIAILLITLEAAGLQAGGRLTVCVWIAVAWLIGMVCLAMEGRMHEMERRIADQHEEIGELGKKLRHAESVQRFGFTPVDGPEGWQS